MPNWCLNCITIIGPSVDATKNFYNLIEEWSSKQFCDNRFGLNWLGNIVGNSGIDNPEDGKIECRGRMTYIYYDNKREIQIDTETAWGPMNEMWTSLIERYLPDGEFYYTAEEPGNEVYLTNDPDYIEKYYFDNWGEERCLTKAEKRRYQKCVDAHESRETLSFDEIKAIINALIPRSIDLETEEELLDKWNESNFRDLAAIHKWEYEAA